MHYECTQLQQKTLVTRFPASACGSEHANNAFDPPHQASYTNNSSPVNGASRSYRGPRLSPAPRSELQHGDRDQCSLRSYRYDTDGKPGALQRVHRMRWLWNLSESTRRPERSSSYLGNYHSQQRAQLHRPLRRHQ